MGKKMHYPGSTHLTAPAGVVSGELPLCDERSCDRIDVHYTGTRGGTYMTSITPSTAVTLIIKLEAEVTRIAMAKGYTCPTFARLAEHRRDKRQII